MRRRRIGSRLPLSTHITGLSGALAPASGSPAPCSCAQFTVLHKRQTRRKTMKVSIILLLALPLLFAATAGGCPWS